MLVDEFQDTNVAQWELVRMLAEEHRSIMVVGDDAQSVYKFRGADFRNLLRFEEAFPEATVVVLDQNYRSTQRILEAANSVIANNASTARSISGPTRARAIRSCGSKATTSTTKRSSSCARSTV